jgi:hypothetical protein
MLFCRQGLVARARTPHKLRRSTPFGEKLDVIEPLDVLDSPYFRTEIHFDRFDVAAASSEEFRVAKWLPVVRLQIVEDKGFVAAIEKLANVDSFVCLLLGQQRCRYVARSM